MWLCLALKYSAQYTHFPEQKGNAILRLYEKEGVTQFSLFPRALRCFISATTAPSVIIDAQLSEENEARSDSGWQKQTIDLLQEPRLYMCHYLPSQTHFTLFHPACVLLVNTIICIHPQRCNTKKREMNGLYFTQRLLSHQIWGSVCAFFNKQIMNSHTT